MAARRVAVLTRLRASGARLADDTDGADRVGGTVDMSGRQTTTDRHTDGQSDGDLSPTQAVALAALAGGATVSAAARDARGDRK